nr:ATP-binding domain-containing protein [Anaerolineae bacterium]
SRVLEDAFVRANLPYRLVGATRFYSRREIKDIIAYLRLIHNPDDQVSLERIINTPPRGLGAKTLDTLNNWARKLNLSVGGALLHLADNPEDGPFTTRARSSLLQFAQMFRLWRDDHLSISIPALLKTVLNETRFIEALNDGTDQGAERVSNVIELINLASEYEELPLSTFLEEIALVSDVDNYDTTLNAPSLLTLHAAKGLEFDCVFLVGLEEGILPHQRSKDDPEQMAEERRLMYVGMTRARKYLYLVSAFRRSVWGESTLNLRSRFVDDIPSELVGMASSSGLGYVRQQVTRPPRLNEQTSTESSDMPYREGQRVLHPKFGEGIVIQCKKSGTDQEVSVAFESEGLKRLLASFAKLTIIED